MAAYYGRDHSTTYSTGSCLGRGGEGSVYDITGRPELVAKIYYDSKFTPTAQTANPRGMLKEKIETMLDQPVKPYINGVLVVAWPLDILMDQNGRFVGYIMPRVKSRYHIFAASRERERVQLYPHYTWRTAILIAYNLALSVKLIHKADAEIGDLNPNNIMIDERGHVTLIDTDSFNITNKKTGKVYKCAVGVPEMLPPELQGRNLALPSSVFNRKTDSFALAIHVFNLLMNNCHPFGCIGMNNSRSSSSTNPVAYNIAKGNCPYISGKSSYTSSESPDYMMLPSEIRKLFERTFRYDATTAVKSSTISLRPEAEEWQTALGRLYKSSMKDCRKVSGQLHVFPASYTKCPWCEIRRNKNTNRGITTRVITPISKQKNVGTIAGNNVNTVAQVPSKPVKRESWPLLLACVTTGVITGPLIAYYALPACTEYFGCEISYQIACIIFAILGAISGALISDMGMRAYQTADNGWPWMSLALLTPIGTVIETGAIALALFIATFVITIIIYGFVIAFAFAVIGGLISN